MSGRPGRARALLVGGNRHSVHSLDDHCLRRRQAKLPRPGLARPAVGPFYDPDQFRMNLLAEIARAVIDATLASFGKVVRSLRVPVDLGVRPSAQIRDPDCAWPFLAAHGK